MRKSILLLINCIMLLTLWSCSKEDKDLGISLVDYSNELTELSENYEAFLSEYMLLDYFHMIDLIRFNRDYNNEQIENNLIDITDHLEKMQPLLSELGAKTRNEIILENQSDLEDAIDEMIQIYKIAQNNKTFQVTQPNQFTLYDETYKLLRDLSIPIQKYYDSIFQIVRELETNNVSFDEFNLHTMLKNRLRFDYYYLVFATQVSTYQDYTGLRVNPNRSEFILFDNDIHRVSELDPSVMTTLITYLSSELKLLDNIQINHNEIYHDVNELIDTVIKEYHKYFALRSQFPSNFFVSNDFKTYQIKAEHFYDNRKVYMLAKEIDFTMAVIDRLEYFSFDFENYPEYKFDIMDEAYLNLQRLIFNKKHKENLFYEHIIVEPFEWNGIVFD